jgi:hypothetical protein
MEVYLFYCNLKDIKVNNIDKKVLITGITDKINVIDEKIITSDFEIRTGDLIDYQFHKWLIISEIPNVGNMYRGKIRKCNNILRYKAIIDGIDTIIEVNTVIDNGTISLDTNKYMIMEDNTLSCQVGYSELSKIKNMTVGFRFILNDTIWKIEGINKVSGVLNKEQGIINIKLTSDIWVDNDDRIKGIADNEDIIITTIHTILLESTVTNTSITINKTGQITTFVTDNGVVVNNPVLTYSSSDNNIATVSANGLISGVAEGNAIITVNYTSLDNIIHTTTIEIIVIIAVARTFTISGASTISNATPIVDKVYTVIDNATGLACTDLTFVFTSSNLTNCGITTSTNNTVTLHPINPSQVKITATSGTYSCFKVIAITTGF